ncbi:hypothetical protein Save01_07383 [Streptomyces avermitilis]
MLQHSPPTGQTRTHIGKRNVRPDCHVLTQRLRLRPQPSLRPSRHRHRNRHRHRHRHRLSHRRRHSHWSGHRLSHRNGKTRSTLQHPTPGNTAPRRRRLLQNHMRIRAADPERRHSRPPQPPCRVPRPRHRLRQQPHRPRGPVHLRRRLIHMQRPRQHPLPQRHHHLDDPTHTRGSHGVPDVGLQRPQPQRPVTGPLPVRGEQRLCLDRITQRRARPVPLHHIHIRHGQPRVRQRLPDHPLLSRTVRRRQPIRRTVLVDRTAAYHRQHPMPQPHRIRQPLHQQHPDALAPAGAVGCSRVRLAPAVHRQPALPGELDEHAEGGHDRDAAGQRERALTRPQRLARQMQRHERCRAPRVHGDRRPFQPEAVGDTARQDAARGTGEDVALHVRGALRRRGVHTRAVVEGEGAREDARTGPAYRQRIDSRPLERLPGRLQQQPLLRIHRQCLTWTDSEEAGVEVRRVVKEPASLRIERAGLRGVLGVTLFRGPSAVGGERPDGVSARGGQLPQVLRGPDSARETACHADDGDRVVRRCRASVAAG